MALRPDGERDIDLLALQTRVKRLLLERRLAGGDRLADLVLEEIEPGSHFLAFLGRHGAQGLHALGDGALLAESRNTDRFECRLVGSAQDPVQDFLFKRVQSHRRSLKSKGRASRRSRAPRGPGQNRKSCGGSESGLRLLDESGKGLWLAHGEIGQNLAVDLDTGLVEPVDKSGIGQPEIAGRGIDALDP